ncbi:MAG: hypothetical protein RL681_850 [Candidatus Parcubacteria bacterium]|jgi:glycosyltransferase involved in cell wall biosynthesis
MRTISTTAPTVSVGITAHNEEANIHYLLRSIFSQRGDFVVEAVTVICDGCTDRTEEIAREFAKAHPNVHVISDGKRVGKTGRLNELYRMNTSDMLITLDADVEPEGEAVFQKLVEPFHDPRVAVVAGNLRPLPGQTFVEKLVVAKEAWWYEARKGFKGGHNIYASSGCCYALSRGFTKAFTFLPESIGDFEIIYLEALHQGKRFVFAKHACVRSREVSTWSELVSRARRFEHGDDLGPYGFTTDVGAEYDIPAKEKLRGFLNVVRATPLYSIGALFLTVALKLIMRFGPKFKQGRSGIYDAIPSTKQLHPANRHASDGSVAEREARYSFELVHRLDGDHQRKWQALWENSNERHFFNSPRFFEACRESCAVAAKYTIVFGFRDGELCVVLPLVQGTIFGIRGLVVPGSAGNFVDKSPLLMDDYSPELMRAVLSEAMRLGNVYLSEMSELETHAIEPHAFPCLVQQVSRSPFAAIIPDSDVLRYMPSRQRHTMERHLRDMAGEIKFHIGGIEALGTVVDIERRSYRPKRHMAFFTGERQKRFLEAVAKQIPDSVKIGVLSFRGKPIATLLGFSFGRIFCTYHTAFDEEYRRFGPGKMAFFFMLEEMKRQGYTDIDFLRGDSELKQQFAREVRVQYDVYVSQYQAVMLWWRIALAVWRTLKNVNARLRKSSVMNQSMKLKSSS